MSCTFPVCPSSPSQCIIAAFQQSGYFSSLEVFNPSNYKQLQQAAMANPSGWLSSHTYLYTAYPNYFAPSCHTTSSGGPSINIPETGNPSDILGALFPNLSELQSQTQTSQQVSQQQTSGNPIIQAGQDVYGAIANFGGFLEHLFGRTIPNLLTGGASAFSTTVEALGKFPAGGILLIVIIVLLFIFSKI
jgi:hypothetical protein